MSAPIYLDYRLTLGSPAIIKVPGSDPNSAATALCIPGSAIRGTLAGRLLQGGVSAEGDEFRRLILSGDVRYLNAYPEIGEARSLPTPRSWRREKANPARLHDLAVENGGGGALVGGLPPFASATLIAGFRRMNRPGVGGRLHQQRDREVGRPWAEEKTERAHGTIFSYEYLEAGQAFRGRIVCDERDTGRIKELLALPLLVGRSRRAGYGGEARVEFLSESGAEYLGASGHLEGDLAAGDVFHALLVSAYIGRHPHTGQPDPVTLELELAAALAGAAECRQRHWGVEIAGGFNRTWRREFPQALAVAAGSVLVLRAGRNIAVSRLRAIEHAGLGERRTEGYGRILFLAPGPGSFDIEDEPSRAIGFGPTGEAEDLTFVAERVLLAAARAELERNAAELAAPIPKECTPRPALIGRLRQPLRAANGEAAGAEALKALEKLCADLKKTAGNQLDRCRVGTGKSLRSWLKAPSARERLAAVAQRHRLRNEEESQGILGQHEKELDAFFADALLACLARKARKGEA